MQIYEKITEEIKFIFFRIPPRKRVYPAFLIIFLLAYFPLWSGMMALKNDALTLSYSMYHFFSEQIRNGVMPWWHHNLHLGFPLHADPGFPFWSPLTWIAGFTGSSLYVYTGLVMVYLAIAGAGMIKLTQWLRFSFSGQLLISLSYVLSGFFVAHLQHPHHIFEAAFIPFCLLFFLRLVQAPGLRNALLLSVCLFFLVNSGYPSFPISTAYFFALLLGTLLLCDKTLRSPGHLRRLISCLGITLLISILLCLPYLASVYELQPLYNRGGAAIRDESGTGGITALSLLSLLFPLASALQPDFFGTNITWNNVYIGLLPLIFAIVSIRYARHRLKLPLIVAGATMLLFSMQGAPKALFNKVVPLFDLVYSNGGYRIYFMLALLLIGGWGIEACLKSAGGAFAKRILAGAIVLFIAVACFSFSSALPPDTVPLKDLIKGISLKSGFFFQSLLGITVLLLIRLAWTRKRVVLLAGCAELVLAFMINLPFTGLGITRLRDVQHTFDSIARAVNTIPPDAPLETIRQQAGWSRFLPQPLLLYHSIGKIDNGSYPSGLRHYTDFLSSGDADEINNKRVVFSSSELTGNPGAATFTDLQVDGSRFSFHTHTILPADTLIILQNIYPNWKYYVNDTEVRPATALGTFTAIPLQQAQATVTGIYRPSATVICFWVSIFVWGIVIFKLLKKASPTQNVYRNR